jgi:hypothetical protein
MFKIFFVIIIISLLISACGVSENPANDSLFKTDEIIPTEIIEVLETTIKPPSRTEIITTTTPPEPKLEPEQNEIIKKEILEPFILLHHGWNIFTSNRVVSSISLCGVVKQMEYEHEDGEDIYNVNMYRFLNVVYNQMNDDSIPTAAQLNRIPDEIIELGKIVETLELDTLVGLPAENWDYYIIVGTDEDRRAIFIGDRKNPRGGNELTRMINEYLEPIIGRVLY